jgi:hypothetical protein
MSTQSPASGELPVAVTDSSIEGKWSVVTDSTFTGYEFSPAITVNVYKGVAADYFEFTATDSLYIQLANYTSTGLYELSLVQAYPYRGQLTDIYNSIDGDILPEAELGLYAITALTDHTMTIETSPGASTPETRSASTIHLEK